MVKVAVTSDEGHVVVQAALRDQRIRQLGLVAGADDPRAEAARALPVTRLEVQGGDLEENLLEWPRQPWVAEHLGQDNGRETSLALGKSDVDRLDVLARGTSQIMN
jgi:hypothetical protein